MDDDAESIITNRALCLHHYTAGDDLREEGPARRALSVSDKIDQHRAPTVSSALPIFVAMMCAGVLHLRVHHRYHRHRLDQRHCSLLRSMQDACPAAGWRSAGTARTGSSGLVGRWYHRRCWRGAGLRCRRCIVLFFLLAILEDCRLHGPCRLHHGPYLPQASACPASPSSPC